MIHSSFPSVRQTCTNVVSDAPRPHSRFLSALSEMPLRSDTVFCERFLYNRSRFSIDPMSTSRSYIFPSTITASF